MTEWTEERNKRLKELWKEDLSCTEVAVQLGGFEHWKDKGKAAVIKQVAKLRLAAKEAGRLEEESFWKREWKKKHKRGGKKRPPRNSDKVLTKKQAEEVIGSVVVEKIDWPTNEELDNDFLKRMMNVKG